MSPDLAVAFVLDGELHFTHSFDMVEWRSSFLGVMRHGRRKAKKVKRLVSFTFFSYNLNPLDCIHKPNISSINQLHSINGQLMEVSAWTYP